MPPRKPRESTDPNEEITFTFRVKRHLRDGFNQACKNVDTSSSRELRAFMRRYVQKYGQEELF